MNAKTKTTADRIHHFTQFPVPINLCSTKSCKCICVQIYTEIYRDIQRYTEIYRDIQTYTYYTEMYTVHLSTDVQCTSVQSCTVCMCTEMCSVHLYTFWRKNVQAQLIFNVPLGIHSVL